MAAAVCARPRRRYSEPAYPTKLVVLATPELLTRHQPAAWLTNRDLAAAAATLFAVGTSGCTESPPTSVKRVGGGDVAAIVAPIFDHGVGNTGLRGMLGCIAIAAPVYLSEEEAFQVIREEFAQAGIDALERNVELTPVVVSGKQFRARHEWISGDFDGEWVDVAGPLRADVIDPAHGIAVEFVSGDECYELGGNLDGEYSRDVKQTAADLATLVRTHGRGLYFGAFYEPVNWYRFGHYAELPNDQEDAPEAAEAETWQDYERRCNEAERASQDTALEESKALLRQQVRDFIDWLEAQGVI